MPRVRRKTPLVDRFWAKVAKTDDCWEWTGTKNARGYGAISLGGRDEGRALAHRLSYQLNVGPIADGLCVLHRCDNPGCVRPEHLYIGDRAANNAEMRSKRRHAFGIRHKNTRLSDVDVLKIRERYASGDVDAQSLADAYGVARGYLYEVIRGNRRDDAPMVAMRPRRMKYEWSRNYPACISCGTTEARHNAHGLCMTCYMRQHQRP